MSTIDPRNPFGPRIQGEPPMDRNEWQTRLQEAIVGPDPTNQRLYRTSPLYKAWVQAMAMSLVEMSPAVAQGAAATKDYYRSMAEEAASAPVVLPPLVARPIA